MPCYKPMTAYLGREPHPETGKLPIVFNHRDGYYDQKLQLPCGQCIGCRLEKSRQWAIRCIHEAQMHDENCFITLTFDDEHLPENNSLTVRHFQLFMKKLRKHFPFEKIRYFHCGEYGEENSRPHHHACLFGFDFPDREEVITETGSIIQTSQTLQKIWGNGFVQIGEVTFESAAYVARYVMKKVTGEKAQVHYQGKKPEYITMSRRPGIGQSWFKKYVNDIYPNDFIVIRNGIKCGTPKYYDTQFDLQDPKQMAILKGIRERRGKQNPDNKEHRLAVKEIVKKSQIKSLRRTL